MGSEHTGPATQGPRRQMRTFTYAVGRTGSEVAAQSAWSCFWGLMWTAVI